MLKKYLNFICHFMMPFIFIWVNFYLNASKGFSSKWVDILEGALIGVFFIVITILTKSLMKQFKLGYYLSILSIGIYLFWYILIYTLARTTTISFHSPIFTLATPLPGNIHFIIAAIIVVFFQKFDKKIDSDYKIND